MSKAQDEQMNLAFKQAAKTFMEQQAIDAERLATLEQLLTGHMGEKPASQRQDVDSSNSTGEHSQGLSTKARRLYSLLALAVCLVVAFAISLNYEPRLPELAAKIADEVAMNHINMKPLELKSAQMSPLRKYFTELNFSVVNSSLFATQHNHMLGGRYSSIQGISAAQIRYQSDSGQRVTLYQVGYDPQIYGVLPKLALGEAPLIIDTRGVRVLIWVEKGLLMAEARNLD